MPMPGEVQRVSSDQMATAIARYEAAPIAIAHERSIEELVAQADKIRLAMDKAMQENHHFGKIPGTPKPTLFKPGAEKLCLLFRLDPQYHSEPVGLDTGAGGHLTIKSVCTLWHIPTGQRFGSGEATCSTRESKYAYRIANRVCPECGKEAIVKGRTEYGGGWLCFKRKDGCGAKFKDGDPTIEGQETGRVANPDLADAYNTVLKMSNKRALVAAVLNVTAASDVFTQDLEDFRREEEDAPAPEPPAREVTPPRDEQREFLMGRIKSLGERFSREQRKALWEEVMGAGVVPSAAPLEDLHALHDKLAAMRRVSPESFTVGATVTGEDFAEHAEPPASVAHGGGGLDDVPLDESISLLLKISTLRHELKIGEKAFAALAREHAGTVNVSEADPAALVALLEALRAFGRK